MGVKLDGNIVHLEGRCNVEDAEPLFQWLREDRGRIIELAEAEHLHAAIVQVLLALRPAITGFSQDSFIREWITPLLHAENPADAWVEKA